MPWHKLFSLESMRSGWAGRSLAAAFQKSIGGAVPVECMLHAPQADNVFDVGSSGVRKL